MLCSFSSAGVEKLAFEDMGLCCGSTNIRSDAELISMEVVNNSCLLDPQVNIAITPECLDESMSPTQVSGPEINEMDERYAQVCS